MSWEENTTCRSGLYDQQGKHTGDVCLLFDTADPQHRLLTITDGRWLVVYEFTTSFSDDAKVFDGSLDDGCRFMSDTFGLVFERIQ